MGKCSVCGAEISHHSKYCPQCGELLPVPPTAAGSKDYLSGSQLLISIAVTFGIFVFLLHSCSSVSSDRGSSSTVKKTKVKTYYTYSSAVDDFAGAMNDADAKKMFELMLPEAGYSRISQEQIQSTSESIASINEVMKMLFPKFKYDFRIAEKTEMDLYDLNSAIEYYTYYLGTDDFTITEGYHLEVIMKSYDEMEDDHIYFDVLKFKGEGWKVSEKALQSAFGIPSPAFGSGGAGFDK